MMNSLIKTDPDRAITDGVRGTTALSIVPRQPDNVLFTRVQSAF